jgi:lysophospholipase L1-like esterase
MSRKISFPKLLLIPITFIITFNLMGCADNAWNYVALGDSYPAGYGAERSYVDYFAKQVEADLGVRVEIHNFARTGLTTSGLLSLIRNDGEIREAIRDTDIITLWIGWNDFRDPLLQYYAGNCGGDENLDCFLKTSEEFNKNIDAVLDEILTLTSPQETIIRIADAGIPLSFMNTWQQQGMFETLQELCFEVWRDYLVEAAHQRNITVVYTYQVLNGSNGNEIMKGIYQSDGIHFNARGQRLIADLHREVGYEYAP